MTATKHSWLGRQEDAILAAWNEEMKDPSLRDRKHIGGDVLLDVVVAFLSKFVQGLPLKNIKIKESLLSSRAVVTAESEEHMVSGDVYHSHVVVIRTDTVPLTLLEATTTTKHW